jgi:2-phospho-L-lactate guanylyltransferase
MTTTWAIVPVKPLYRSKSRLAEVLSPAEREELSRSMLEHTLAVLAKCEGIHGVLVVSRDPAALAVAREYGVNTVQESGSPELNEALERAAKVVTTWGAKRVLILPCDLPLVTLADVQALLANGHHVRQVAVAPDRREEGTNALLMKPPGLFELAFGVGSFPLHLQRAEEAGAVVSTIRSESLALDIDLPEDLAVYREIVTAKSA